MKNVFKFGFLGLALTLGIAACNNTTSQSEQTADSLTNEIEQEVDAVTDSIDSIGSRAIDSLDSLAQ
ncbi:hypothetical protein ACFQRK_01070 [Parapedobacter sp. GCM10030251]|jgi:hypothetical protein|uniref:hypothetical protein n=1 Tax=Parapedobacter sp. GCM10030251 TaxID=3273419 RepID=UPI0036124F3E